MSFAMVSNGMLPDPTLVPFSMKVGVPLMLYRASPSDDTLLIRSSSALFVDALVHLLRAHAGDAPQKNQTIMNPLR